MKLTEHFTLEELTFSDLAVRYGIDNTPNAEQIANLAELAAGLEEVRALLGDKPIHINSGYRCPVLNKNVGGSDKSAHMSGLAADFTCGQFGKPESIVAAIAGSSILFDQCIHEGTWVHFAVGGANRKQAMTATFDEYGRATYKPFEVQSA